MLNVYKNNIILNLTEKFNYSKDLTSVLVSNNYSIDKLKPIADEILKNNSCIYISVVEKYNVVHFFLILSKRYYQYSNTGTELFLFISKFYQRISRRRSF